MRSAHLLIGLVACAAALACDAQRPETPDPARGTLALPLLGESAGGAEYRLQAATFTILGGAEPVEVAGSGDIASAIVDLEPGDYLVRLEDGWRLQRRDEEGVFEDVAAVLLSQNPQAVSVAPGVVSQVVFRFGVGDDQVAMGDGRIRIVIDVEDGSEPGGGGGGGGAACDPRVQDCASGEKCTSRVADAEAGQFETVCAPAGPVPEGGACMFGPDGVDDCAAGLACIGGACAAICDLGGEAPPDCACTGFAGIFADLEGVGVCEPTCDPLAQDCQSGEACYPILASGTAQCATPLGVGGEDPGTQGDDCQYVNTCAPGFACALLNDRQNPTGNVCAALCDALDGDPSCAAAGAGFTCVAISAFYGDIDTPPELGMCVDCVEWAGIGGCAP